MRSLLALTLLAPALLLAACGGSASSPTDSGAPDATVNPDATAPEDAHAPDGSPDANADAAAPDAVTPDTGIDAGNAHFTIAGTVSFDWVDAKDDVTEGGVRLDYPGQETRPARRILVQALALPAMTSIAQTYTDDLGHYSLDITAGRTVRIRARAETQASNDVPDGIPPDRCSGATWHVRVVDNTQRFSTYAVDDTQTHAADATVNIHAALSYRNNSYRDRSAAPFAMLDILIREFELLCEAAPDITLPLLLVNWSVDNVPEGDDIESGRIGTSYYDASNLYIVGKEDVDTDEYDDHIIAHETGHYFEDVIYRSDTNGGTHRDFDVLDPSTAFSEGFGNAISGMTFDDPVYVDTSGVGQADGFAFGVDVPPHPGDRGIYSEWSDQYFLWSLYENRDTAPNSGNYDRIHDILRNYQRTSEALTTVQTFAAYYNQTYGGDAEQLSTLWGVGLDSPFDALCAGPCTGRGDRADPFDVDNDLGLQYSGAGTSTIVRLYPERNGAAYPAEFWQLYRPLQLGVNATTAHDQSSFNSYHYTDNKWGAVRWYRYVGTGMVTSVSVSNLGASSCNEDVLDMAVYDAGVELDSDYSAGGCPSVTFPTTLGRTYVIVLYGLNTELPSWQMEVAASKNAPPILVDSKLADGILDVDLTPLHDFRALSVHARGVDGVLVEERAPRTQSQGRRGDHLQHRIKARAPEGVAGYVALDISLFVEGRRYAFTKLIPLNAPGAQRKLTPLGRLEESADGERVELLAPRE